MNVKNEFLKWFLKRSTYKSLSETSVMRYIDEYVEFLAFDPFEVNDDFSNIEEIKSKIDSISAQLKENNSDYVDFQKRSSSNAPLAILGKNNYSVFLDELKNKDKIGLLDLNSILSRPVIQSVIQYPDFYFQKGQDALKKWINLEIKEELKNTLISLSKDYKKIQEEAAKRDDLKQILDLLFEITTYCDNHAKEKSTYNRYDDKRALADAGVRMNSWIEKLIQFKFTPMDVGTGSTQNAFDYLLDPLNNSTILSENHRKNISENFIKKAYDKIRFVEDLKSFFALYNLNVINPSNYTHLLMWIVYSLQDLWKDQVIGLMASDGTGWQDNYIQEMEGYDAAIIWNSKRPSGTGKTLKFLKDIIDDGGSFNLYYCSGGIVTHKATIIDFVENQKELDRKNWSQKLKIYAYQTDFVNYNDGKKKSSIVFLANSLEKIIPIPISKFEFYGKYSIPRQDNLSPIKREASIVGTINSKKFREVIEDVKSEINSDEKTNKLFVFENSNSDYVWIKDSLGIIGNSVCHYEISVNKVPFSYTVDVHFEGKNLSDYQQFDPILKNLPFELKRFKWYKKGDSIRYGNGISSNHPDLIKELKSQLYYIEENIGDKLREIIKKSKPKQIDHKMDNKLPLNQILFGPPGTGKTFNTINKAIAIANPDFDLSKPRNEIKQEFERLKEEGQVVFTTFHQSMNYEDFIEGIKPLKPNQGDSYLKYDVLPGIFKKICQDSKTPNLVGFYSAYENLKSELTTTELLSLKTPTGKEFSISLNSNDNLTLHTGQDKEKQGTLTKENIQKQINGEEKFKGWEGYFKGVIEYLRTKYNYSENESIADKNYVLIIDEINRGNVSQIFGELITLVEEDKRIGKDEALEVTLPYSKEKFGVPSNLYIIGTMNTADRSVEAIDSALRRRFSFEEVPPKYDLDELQYEFAGVKGFEILQIINKRIEKLLDKDHQIGHSYLMKNNNIDVKEMLLTSFYKNIIPLLQEYFFGDFGKIGLVLGNGFVQKREWNKDSESFAEFDYESASEFNDRPIYEIIDHRGIDQTSNSFVKAIQTLMRKKIE